MPSATGARSSLEVVPVPPSDRKVAYFTSEHLEAPNWSPDGKFFIFNQGGQLYKMPTNGAPELINTGTLNHINNDHGISPDGTMLAISDQTLSGGSRIYVLPVAGGTPRLLTSNAPSYFHGWSPDGKTLAFCGQRTFTVNGQRADNFDIYTVPAAGGPETRLTTDPGKDDGPDYSSDGKYIYFNSDRTGHMQVWRMKRGRLQPGTDHHGRIRQRLPASLARRALDCVLQLSARRGGSSREQGRDAAPDAHDAGRANPNSGEDVWRPGNDQCQLMGAQ